MAISTDKNKIIELLTRGVEEIIDRKHLMERLDSGKELRVKLGIDPTSPNLHLGRSIPLLKLRDFQELGHKVVFIVGDATGVIGDTSDKDSERPMLTREDVEKNLQSYKEQVGKILNLEKTEFRHNSEWLNKLSYEEIGEHANVFSVSEFISRDNIRRRLEAGTRVSLREVLYPLMQGYDSVAIKADVELGGTDQRFNLLAGRKLQVYFKQESQNIIMGPLMAGTDGRKMSSSWGNVINLMDQPNDMFGKVMSLPDDLIMEYFTLVTRVPVSDLAGVAAQLKSGANPRDVKAKLAREIVKLYHDEKSAAAAEQSFEKQFKNKEIPEDILAVSLEAGYWKPEELLVKLNLVSSKTAGRRMVEQGGVKINGQKIIGPGEVVVKSGDVVQVGRRKFIRLK